MYYALLAFGTTAVGVASVFPFVFRWSLRRRFALSMAGRKILSEKDFAAFFPGSEETANAVRAMIARVMPGDGRLMLPSDRIAADLWVGAIDGLDSNEIVAGLERQFAIRIPEIHAAEVRTVQELIELVQLLRDENSIDCSFEGHVAPMERRHCDP
jgi:acyl carrier protein